MELYPILLSHPPRGEWIEILTGKLDDFLSAVSPPAG